MSVGGRLCFHCRVGWWDSWAKVQGNYFLIVPSLLGKGRGSYSSETVLCRVMLIKSRGVTMSLSPQGGTLTRSGWGVPKIANR